MHRNRPDVPTPRLGGAAGAVRHAVLAVTLAGGGFTVLPRYLCRRALAEGALVVLPEPPAPVTGTIRLATPAGPPAPGVEGVVRCLLAQVPGW